MKWKRRGVVTALVFLLLSGSTVGAWAQQVTRPPGVVNINTASVDQLTLLPGIGQGRATRIVAFRALKPFKRVVELARVKGIGMKTVRRLKGLLVVQGPTTLSQRPFRTR